MPEIDRRKFLRAVVGVPIGVAVSAGSAIPEWGSAILIENMTDMEAGNANTEQMLQDNCVDIEGDGVCDSYEFSPSEEAMITLTAPVVEEVFFRAMPSAFLDELESENDPTVAGTLGDMIIGTEGKGLSRRELIVGGLSSFAFGIAHNDTSNGFNTNFIPVPQMIFGMSMWWLQRRFGMLSNITAHISRNSAALWFLKHQKNFKTQG